MAQVYVGNLKPRVSKETIEDVFRPYSAGKNVRITRKSQKFAFVDFDDRNDALEAIRILDGKFGWKVKLSDHSKKGRVGGGEELTCSYEYGEQGYLTECATRSRKFGWKVKLSDHSKKGGDGGGGEELKCSDECGEQGHFAECAIRSRKIDVLSNQGSGKNISSDDDKQEACGGHGGDVVSGGRVEELKCSDELGHFAKVNVVIQHNDHDKVRSKSVGMFEPKKPSFDKLAQNEINSLNAKLEETERELAAVGVENESLKRLLNEANLEIFSAKAKEENMTLNSKKLEEELEKSKNHVSFAKAKGEDMSLMLKQLRAELEKSKSNLSSAKAKEAEMNLKLKKVQEELEKVKNNASSTKTKGDKMNLKLIQLEEELKESKKNVIQLNEKLKEVEGSKETLETEMKNTNVKTEKWRKAAGAAATVFAVGVEINSEIPEFGSVVLFYFNQATTRMLNGRVREALWYCTMAAAVDPDFLKAHLTAANCHLVLGEIEDALYNYNKCLQSENILCSDRRITIEAADGIQKAQKVVSCIKQSSELLQQKTFNSAAESLEVVGEALSISRYSETLLEMKGEALLVLRKYEEVVQLCEKTLKFAETNFTNAAVMKHVENVDNKNSLKLWRWNLMCKSYFRLGRLEVALNFIEIQEQLRSSEDKIEELSSPFAVTVRELLQLKNAGNEAFNSGRHAEAVEFYTKAISRNTESHPFLAVCFCNRAAAHQALGEIIDAIADCNLAIALDRNYIKALFRRAALHEKIRDYEQAANDLRRLISVLEKQSLENSQQPSTPGRRPDCSEANLSRYRDRLSSIEEKAKKRTTLDLYLILGVNSSDSASDIKKAYRKAALRHHPDKAGQFLPRSESGDDAQLWTEVADMSSKNADRLFKAIGEAYAVLQDYTKRLMYDLKEEIRGDRQ